MDTKNPIIREMKAFAGFTSGRQRAYCDTMIRDAKPIEVSPLKDVFTEGEIAEIKKLDLQPKMCYRNAFLLTELYPDKVKYCEGKYSFYGIGIEHAFNKIGDKFVDITAELILKNKPSDIYYVLLGEYNFKRVSKEIYKFGFWGDIYNRECLRKTDRMLKKQDKSQKQKKTNL